MSDRLRQLLELANKDFSVENFNDELLNETKNLLVEIAGSTISFFSQGKTFGISKPEYVNKDQLKIKVESNLGIVFLIFDKNGNIV